MRLQSRLKRFLSFLSITYDAQANAVVITLRLNTAFVLGAAVAATIFMLVLNYGGISLGSVLALLSDLWRCGSWLWIGAAAAFTCLAVAARRRDGLGPGPAETDFWSRVASQLPKGLRGTALLCLALLAILILVMWAASGGTAITSDLQVEGARDQSRPTISGEEMPRMWHEIQKAKRR